jgi:hypothetical protein
MKRSSHPAFLSAALLLAGCGTSTILDDRTIPDRPNFGAKALPVPPAPPPHVDIVNEDPTPNPAVALPDQITGTWSFVTPPTVTRVERRNENLAQYSLYLGRPAPDDTPFLVITVSRDPRGIAEGDPATYKIANQRQYTLNGNLAKEWTGNTTAGAGYCELLLTKPAGTGDVCHAMAIAKTEEQRKLALDILASISWKPAQP